MSIILPVSPRPAKAAKGNWIAYGFESHQGVHIMTMIDISILVIFGIVLEWLYGIEPPKMGE